VIDSPPPRRGTVSIVPPCAPTTARTIDRPSPAPSADPTRSARSRRNGS
jgi:hypothetical protein